MASSGSEAMVSNEMGDLDGEIHYALKANSNLAVIKAFAALGAGMCVWLLPLADETELLAAVREALAAAGVAVPAYHRYVDVPPEEVRFPCVLKPPMLTGSQGVIRADDAADFAVALTRVRAQHPGHHQCGHGHYHGFESRLESGDHVRGSVKKM